MARPRTSKDARRLLDALLGQAEQITSEESAATISMQAIDLLRTRFLSTELTVEQAAEYQAEFDTLLRKSLTPAQFKIWQTEIAPKTLAGRRLASANEHGQAPPRKESDDNASGA